MAAVCIAALAASGALSGCEVDSDEKAVLGRGSDSYVDGHEEKKSKPSDTGVRRSKGAAGASAGRSGGASGASGGAAGRGSAAAGAGAGGAAASGGRDAGADSSAPHDAGPAPDAEGGDVQDVPPDDHAGADASAAEGGKDDGESGDAGAGGRERDRGRNQGRGSTNAFFDALLTLIESVLSLDPVEASSQLLALLSAATGLDPEALGGLILWIDEADLCRDDATLCEVACGLLEGRCSACAEQETCREAVKRVCVDRIDACY